MVKVRKFLDEWTDDSLGTKPIFVSLFQVLLEIDEA